MVLAESFLVLVVQEMMLALGVALAGANVWALIQNRRRSRAYARELAEYRETKRGKGKPPPKPEIARVTPAVVNIVIGVVIALVAVASLTFDWIT